MKRKKLSGFTGPWTYKLTLRSFPGGAVVNSPAAGAGDERDAGSIPGREDPLEEEMATLSSVLAWRIAHRVTKSQGTTEET